MQGLNHVLGSDSVYYFFLILKGLRLPIILDFIFLVCKMQKTELCQYLSFFFFSETQGIKRIYKVKKRQRNDTLVR